MLQPKILEVAPLQQQRLMLRYETGEVRIFDVKPYISGSWYGRLADDRYFRTVHLIPGGSGIEWSEGQDIAPHELYELSTPA